jgi:beta-xylosidase
MGVARAKDLLGPWEKYEKNPLFNSNEQWKCPGHGTPVEKDGKFFLLYHAYHAKGDVYAGRQGVLKEFRFTEDGWIELLPDKEQPVLPSKIHDEFSDKILSPHWQWSVFHTIQYQLNKGRLELSALPDQSGIFLAQKTYTADYNAAVTIYTDPSKAAAGLAIVGDEKNLISATYKNGKLSVWKLQNDKASTIVERSVPAKEKIHLRVDVANGKDITFSYSTDGKKFEKLNANAVDGFYLPPWDRAIRVALLAKGPTNQKAVFDNFILDNN